MKDLMAFTNFVIVRVLWHDLFSPTVEVAAISIIANWLSFIAAWLQNIFWYF